MRCSNVIVTETHGFLPDLGDSFLDSFSKFNFDVRMILMFSISVHTAVMNFLRFDRNYLTCYYFLPITKPIFTLLCSLARCWVLHTLSQNFQCLRTFVKK